MVITLTKRFNTFLVIRYRWLIYLQEQVNKELEILKDRRTDKYSELKILSDSLIQEDYSAKELSEMDNLQLEKYQRYKN